MVVVARLVRRNTLLKNQILSCLQVIIIILSLRQNKLECLLLGKFGQVSLMIASKAGHIVCQCKVTYSGMLQPCSLIKRNLPMTNTLAYIVN